MITFGRHPSNNPFIEPYARVRTPPGGDVDLAARRIVRSKFAVGFKSDAYVDDPAAQVFNNPGGVSGLYVTGGAQKLGYFRQAANVAAGFGAIGATAADCASGCLIGGTCAPAPYCKSVGPNKGVFDSVVAFFTGPGNDSGPGTAQSALSQRCGGGSHYDFEIGACAEDPSTDAPPAYSFSYAPGAGLTKLKQQVAAVAAGHGSFSDLLPTLGLVGGGIGVVYGLMKHKPKVAMLAGAIGVAALVLPKMMGGSLAGTTVAFEPLAGTTVAFEDR